MRTKVKIFKQVYSTDLERDIDNLKIYQFYSIYLKYIPYICVEFN